jgi:phosphoglycerate dehydrogenase-like enzyme
VKVVAYLALQGGHWKIPDADRDAIERQLPSVRIVNVDSPEEQAAEIGDADVWFGFHFPPELFAQAKRLRWVHSAGAGIEANLFPELVASDVVLTNSSGLHSTCIPEHVLALLFAFARNLPASFRAQGESRWDRVAPLRRGGIREIRGSHLAILGPGAIGKALVEKAAPLGMKIRVMRRHAGKPVPGVERVVGPEGLHELLGWAHFVVLAVPLTAETRNLIDAAALRAMRSDAFLINIARGEVVDQDALVEALREGRLRGAGLDVTTPEPLPPESPLWRMENVIITPHISGYMPGYFPGALAIFTDNLGRYVRGESLRNVVDKRLGYALDSGPAS